MGCPNVQFEVKDKFYQLADADSRLSFVDCTNTLWISGNFGINIRSVG
jgi:hypothetical protein